MKIKRALALLLAMVTILSVSVVGVYAYDNTEFIVKAEQIDNQKAVRLTWDKVRGAKSYTVYRTPYTAYGEIDMHNLEKLAELGKNTCGFIDENLDWFDSFYYFVSADLEPEDLLSTSEANAFVVNPNPVFENEAHVDEVINKIFIAKEKEIAAHIKEQRPQSTEDKYVTLYENCGPTSIAFQKVLADLGIYCEVRRTIYKYDEQQGMTHEYCLMRVNYGNDYSKVHNLIVDPTNRQYLRDSFKNNLSKTSGRNVSEADVDYALLNSGLPAVLVFDYSDKKSAEDKIKEHLANSEYGVKFYDDFVSFAYEGYKYPEQILMMCYDRGLTEAQFKAVKEAGKLNKPFEQDLYINCSWRDKNLLLEYKSNGIYQCFVPVDIIPDYEYGVNNTVTICDSKDNVIFGVKENSYLYSSMAISYSIIPKTQNYLTNETENPLIWNITKDMWDTKKDPLKEGVVVQIDMRAGLSEPLITAYPAQKKVSNNEVYYDFLDFNYSSHIK